ncbi:hypothetical protein H6P81_017688 [Aristolochia fimbriata]|uniref:Integrase catalytic domain-containing protein n=1 Tax=Aristolochia fimbriata TaxID=158543 RepID=A0AAV7E0P1_ARIFI|nr:hypothetical protein H6P81_017688 [Aristolochia fimbriata]
MSEADWEKLDDKALTTIQLCVTHTLLNEVLNEKTATSLSNNLETLYMKKSLTNQPSTLKERIYTLRMAKEVCRCQYSRGGWNVLSVVSDDKTNGCDEWTLDSGCSYHMCSHRHWFSAYDAVDGGVVMMANNSTCRAIGKGSVQLKMNDGVIRTLTDVRYVPDLKRNLISLGTLDSIGCKYSAEGGIMKVSRGVLTVMKGRKIGTLYVLDGSTVTGSTTVASASLTESETTRLWHLRLGHMSERGLNLLSRRGLLCGQSTGKIDFCEHCVFGKHKRVAFNTAIHRTKGTLDYVHSDLWGPSQVVSKGGAKYLLTFIDDFSRKVWVYFLKAKSDVFTIFKQWKCMIEKQTGKQIKRLRTDNGLEFCSGKFNKFCENEGIVRHRTVRHTPQQNGVAERMNITLLERARCML